MSAEQGDPAPDGEHHSDDREKDHATPAVLRLLDSSRSLPSPVLPPGEPVADQQSQTEGKDHLRQEVLEVEEVVDRRDANCG